MNALSLRRKLLLLGAPVVLAGAGLTTMAASAATPTATPSAQQAETPETAAEAAEPAEADETSDTAAELAAEKALPGGGHADSETDANADHQFEGVE
jgi:hypothetical protein